MQGCLYCSMSASSVTPVEHFFFSCLAKPSWNFYAAALVPPTSSFVSAGVHSFSAAAAGAIATMATHPFDVIKVREKDYWGWMNTKGTSRPKYRFETKNGIKGSSRLPAPFGR